MIVLFLFVAIGSVIPRSHTSEALLPAVDPLRRATGFNQRWGMFAPDPLSTEVATSAFIYFDNGTSTVWWPTSTIGRIDSARYERWRKWENRIRLDASEAYWPTIGASIAGRFGTDDNPVVRVKLVRTWSNVPLPEAPIADREHFDFHFYEWNALTGVGRVLTLEDQPDE